MAEYNLKQFFEAVPPGRITSVKNLTFTRKQAGYVDIEYLALPLLTLPCETETCSGSRIFEPTDSVRISKNGAQEEFISYVCRNCKKYQKRYAVYFNVEDKGHDGEIYKYGELPSFGPPTPAKVISLIGPEKDYFLRGRRAESQGLGIAAFAYYRRVIENQKNRIIDEIIRVAAKVGAAPEVLADLERAKAETQFSKAVSEIKHGIPQVLLISGNNPLSLLHSALSEGLHAQTDEQCLELATSVRVVMSELAERMGVALKEEAELAAAVSRLMATNKKPQS